MSGSEEKQGSSELSRGEADDKARKVEREGIGQLQPTLLELASPIPSCRVIRKELRGGGTRLLHNITKKGEEKLLRNAEAACERVRRWDRNCERTERDWMRVKIVTDGMDGSIRCEQKVCGAGTAAAAPRSKGRSPRGGRERRGKQQAAR